MGDCTHSPLPNPVCLHSAESSLFAWMQDPASHVSISTVSTPICEEGLWHLLYLVLRPWILWTTGSGRPRVCSRADSCILWLGNLSRTSHFPIPSSSKWARMMLTPKRPRQSLGKLKLLPSCLVIDHIHDDGTVLVGTWPFEGPCHPLARPQPPTFHLQPSWASLLGMVGRTAQPLPYKPEGSN